MGKVGKSGEFGKNLGLELDLGLLYGIKFYPDTNLGFSLG